MENPEAIFDVLSIRSMKNRYSGCLSSNTRVITPAAIASDVGYLANREALEHFVQDFAIDDSISDCFADTAIGGNSGFAVKAPSHVEQQLLTLPKVSKPTPKTVREVGQTSDEPPKPTPAKTKVTFVLDCEENKSQRQTRISSDAARQSIKSLNPPTSSSSHSNQWRLPGTVASAHVQQTSNVGSGKNKDSCQSRSETEVAKAQRDVESSSATFGDSEKTLEKEKERGSSKLPKFGLSWVLENTLNRNKKHQNQRKLASERYENSPVKERFPASESMKAPLDDHVTLTQESTTKDYSISSIGVVKQNDADFDDLVVAHYKDSVKFPQEGSKEFSHLYESHNKNNDDNDDDDDKDDVHDGEDSDDIDTDISKTNAKIAHVLSKPSSCVQGGNGVKTMLQKITETPFTKAVTANLYSSSITSSNFSLHNTLPSTNSIFRNDHTDHRKQTPWYDNSSSSDVKTTYASSPPSCVQAEGKSAAPLCDVIQRSATLGCSSEKDTDVEQLLFMAVKRQTPCETSLPVKASAKSPRQSEQNCQIETGSNAVLTNTSAAIAQRTNKRNVPGMCLSVNGKGWKSSDTTSGLSPPRNEITENSSAVQSTVISLAQRGRENAGITDVTAGKDTDGCRQGQLVPALELVCAELLARCFTLEKEKQHARNMFPGQYASLQRAAQQLIQLASSASSSTTTDSYSQLSNIAQDVLLVSSSLKNMMESYALKDGAPRIDGIHGEPAKSVCDGLVRSLCKASVGVLESGLDSHEIHKHIRQLVSTSIQTASQTTSHPVLSDGSRDMINRSSAVECKGRESEKARIRSENVGLDEVSGKKKERCRVLSPEEPYPNPTFQLHTLRDVCRVHTGTAQSSHEEKQTFLRVNNDKCKVLTEGKQPSEDFPPCIATAMPTPRLTVEVEATATMTGSNGAVSVKTEKLSRQQQSTDQAMADRARSARTASTATCSNTSTTLTHTDKSRSRGSRNFRGGRRKRRRSHSLSRLHCAAGSSDIFNGDSSSVGEDGESSVISRCESSSRGSRVSRTWQNRRRCQSASRHRRSSSCHSFYSDENLKYNSKAEHDINYDFRKENVQYASRRDKTAQRVMVRKGDNSDQRRLDSSRSASARFQKGRRYDAKGYNDWQEDFGVDDDEDEDEDEEDDDFDEDGESTKVRVNVPNEDFSDDVLRVQRLKQHLQAMHKLRQRNHDVIETVITGTGEKLTPRPMSHDKRPAQTYAHINIGEAYPFRTKENGEENTTCPTQSASLSKTGKQTSRSFTVGKLQSPFKGKLGTMKARLFNHEVNKAPDLVQVRELTESEFEESFERRNDVTVRRRREMDAGIPWDELEFSGRESDATLTAWSDGER